MDIPIIPYINHVSLNCVEYEIILDYPLFVKSLVYLSGTLSPLSSGAMTGIASAKRYLVCIKEGS